MIIVAIITLAVLGFICWLVLQIPMPAPFGQIIIGVFAVLAVLTVLQAFGVNTGLPHVGLR